MANVKNWYGNGLSNGTLTTSSAGPGDDVWSALAGSSGPPTIEAVGSNPRIKIVESAGANNFRWDSLGPINEWGVGFLYRIAAQPSGGCALLQVLDSTPTQICRLEQGSTGGMTLRDTSNTSIATAAAGTIQTDTWYWITVVGTSAGAITVKVYLEDASSPSATLSGSAGTTNDANRATFGSVASVTSSGRYFDSLVVVNKAVEPPQPALDSLPVRVVSNPGLYTASAGDMVDVLGDASDATYIQSVTEPAGDVITIRKAQYSRTDVITETIRAAVTDVSPSVELLIEILHDGVVGASDTVALTTTPTDYPLPTDDPTPAGEIITVRLTATTL